jgi:regulator of protease activity HflC (stomatin/prohibitin superfamily)
VSPETGIVPDGPVIQSLRIGFRVLVLATVLLALAWTVSNLRQVPPGSQAVVLRFGEVARVARSGLVVALPRPFESVELLPSAETQLTLAIDGGGAGGPALVDLAAAAAGQTPPRTAAAFLTGDGGVVVMDATLTWRISEPAAYYLARAHVPAALRRLWLSTATAIAAAGGLDDFLAARAGERRAAGAQLAREALRGALTEAINRRLAALRDSGANLGVAVTRADVDVLLPPSAKIAFDQVLDATQMAEQSIAAARTEATRTLQAADRARDKTLSDANAAATERVSQSSAQVAEITALAGRYAGADHDNLLDQLYRDRIASVLHQAGAVSTVAADGGRLILPAGQSPTPGAAK